MFHEIDFACDLSPSLHGDLMNPEIWSLYHPGRIRRIQRSHQEAELMLKKAVEYAEQNLGHHDMEFACALNQLAKELSELLDVVTVT